MYKIIEHTKTHSHIGGSYEAITESWHLYDPNQHGKYTTITQRKAIGVNAKSTRTYHREGMRLWEDDTKDKRKKEIIREVKEWFDTTTFEWLNL
jgi:hypothetical protein